MPGESHMFADFNYREQVLAFKALRVVNFVAPSDGFCSKSLSDLRLNY